MARLALLFACIALAFPAAAQFQVEAGSTDYSVLIRIVDSTTFLPETAVEHNTAGIDLEYRREGAAVTDITEAALASIDASHSDGGIEHSGAGYYRLDLPDAAVASGVEKVYVQGSITDMVIIGCVVNLVGYDPTDGVNLGLTSLPNAAADAAGGLPISDAGGLALDARLGTDIPAILLDTAEIGTAGAGLTAQPWNAAWDAEVQSEAADALTAFWASPGTLVDLFWDEELTGATHNVATSAGRRLRELGAASIRSGTAQAGADNSITLDTGASATDRIYNSNLIVITEGTGTGQSRVIVEYNGTSKVAVVNRDWHTNPDATSVFQIIADHQADFLTHGIAQGGGASTITLQSDASATDDIYNGAVVIITTSNGTGQSRLITDYNGTSKVATVSPAWQVQPTSASVYVVMPGGGQSGDSYARLGVPAGASVSADNAAIKAETALIVEDTGTTIPGLIAALNNLSAAQVNAEVDIALTDYGVYTGTPPTTSEIKTALEAAESHLALILADTGTDLPAILATLATAAALSTTDGKVDTIDDLADQILAIAEKLDTALELDGAVYRYTANALEQAPAGGGGDATEAKQDSILASLTDAKGATFNTATDSLEAVRDRGDAAWGGVAGSGSVEVNSATLDDSGDNMLYESAPGVGIEGANVWAYVKSEYDVSPVTATRRAANTTLADGSWGPMFLSDGVTYTIVFYKPGAFGPDTAIVTPEE